VLLVVVGVLLYILKRHPLLRRTLLHLHLLLCLPPRLPCLRLCVPLCAQQGLLRLLCHPLHRLQPACQPVHMLLPRLLLLLLLLLLRRHLLLLLLLLRLLLRRRHHLLLLLLLLARLLPLGTCQHARQPLLACCSNVSLRGGLEGCATDRLQGVRQSVALHAQADQG
jgi:hypothetical protein